MVESRVYCLSRKIVSDGWKGNRSVTQSNVTGQVTYDNNKQRNRKITLYQRYIGVRFDGSPSSIQPAVYC
jgi:ribosomal protein S13